MFCGQREPRGKEHVFADNLLNQLRLSAVEFVLTTRDVSTDQKIGEPYRGRLDRFLCAPVCDECNTGWMSRLENLVKPWLKHVLDTGLVDFFSEGERRLAISRWAVKTAFVAARLIKSEELDPSWPRMLYSNRDLLPSGFSIFSAWHEGTALPGISLNHRSRWTEYPLGQPCEDPICVSGRWFKLAFRLNQLMILVVGVPSDHVKTVSVPGLHHTIWPSGRPKLEHWYRGFEIGHLDAEDALTIFSDSLSVLHSGDERNPFPAEPDLYWPSYTPNR